MKLWICICILAAGTGSLIWGMFNLIDGNLIMGFAGLGVALAIPIYLAATNYGMHSGPENMQFRHG